MATGSSDAINDLQVAIVDPKSVPNDIVVSRYMIS